MKLLKLAIFLAVVAFLLPSPPESETGGKPSNAVIDLSDSAQLMTAAFNAAGDVAGFCGRQPTVCDTARHTLQGLELKVKYGIRLLVEWANEPHDNAVLPKEHELQAGADPMATNSNGRQAARSTVNSLEIMDLVPEWRGPKAERS